MAALARPSASRSTMPLHRRVFLLAALALLLLRGGHSRHAGDGNSDGASPARPALTAEQLQAFLKQFQKPQNQGAQSDGTRRDRRNGAGGGHRRKVLYDLSVQAHYDRLKRGHQWNVSSSPSPSSPEAVSANNTTAAAPCEYFNDGMHVTLRELTKHHEESFFSHFSHWTYRLCPQTSVEQMHVEPIAMQNDRGDADATPGSEEILQLPPNSILSSSIEFQLQTIHSLGTYLPPSTPDYASQISAAWGPNEPISPTSDKSVEYYIDGDLCEAPISAENSEQETATTKRQSKVVYDAHCCQRRQSLMEEFFHNEGEIVIQSTEEIGPCQYVLRACRVCHVDKEPEAGNATAPESTGDDTESAGFNHLIETFLQYGAVETDAPDGGAFPPMPPSMIEANKQLIRSMFTHAYDAYFYNAFPASDLQPLTCAPGKFDLVKIPALTLIDTLDTLILMNNHTEFARSVERIRYLDERMKLEFRESYPKLNEPKVREGEEGGLFSLNVDVSLFETTIRVLGGLLSAHQLALAFMVGKVPKADVWDASGDVRSGYPPPADGTSCLWEPPPENATWEYDGLFLDLAHDIGKRLIFAFDTETGIPYGTVNLLYGIPKGETTVASLAGAGTLSLEFELLSRLTDDPSFGKAAKLATRALWTRRHKELNLLGKHIDTMSGKWVELLSGIGSNSDSFYEYLLKHYILFSDDEDFWPMFKTVYSGVHDNSRLGEWYVDVDLGYGLSGHVRQVFESLMAFYPGLQVLLGEQVPSAKTLNSFFLVREFLGLLPERFNFAHWKTEGSGDVHPLRPELLESCYFLHMASIGLRGAHSGPFNNNKRTPYTSSWMWAADFALHAVHKLSWTPCGFATVKKVGQGTTGSLNLVGDHDIQTEQRRLNIQHHNEMPSYFLSETLKYLWLTFDAEENVLHNDSEREWIFTTEAHPIHYVPSETQRQERLNKQLAQLRSLLKEHIAKAKAPQSTDNVSGEGDDSGDKATSAPDLDDEQWTSKTPQSAFLEHLGKVEDADVASKEVIAGSGGFESGPPMRGTSLLPEGRASYGIFYDEIASINQAHHHFESRGKGSGRWLGKSCPNYHHPDLLWNHALHGEALDYNLKHTSYVSDEETFSHDIVDERMLTALASACFYGTDFYADGMHVDEFRSCPVEQAPDHHFESKQDKETTIPGTTRYDMGGELGAFDVSAFPGGDGFVVRHVDSDELMEVSVFHDNPEPFQSSTVILVVLTVPPPQSDSSNEASMPPHLSSRRSSGKNWRARTSGDNVDSVVFKGLSEGEAEAEDDGYRRHVVVGDLDGNAFRCEVVVTKKGAAAGESRKAEEFLSSFPCSPAFFGRANLPKLVQSGGEIVKGMLIPPPPDDKFGCRPVGDNSLIDEDGKGEPSGIPLLRRGDCNFMSKANSRRHSAEGIIVINSNPDELFVMAGDAPGSSSSVGDGDLPVSVLVSGQDGEAILQLMQGERSKGSEPVEATILLTKESEEFLSFPFVTGTKDHLQILASNGWGIHSVPPSQTGKGSGSSSWQLFITKHERKE
ncbi:hypothetical protein ACHAXT_010113 [Thalassiosira profunda]